MEYDLTVSVIIPKNAKHSWNTLWQMFSFLFPGIDIDECDEDNGNCEQECLNTPGSFQCRCGSGFQLREDGRTCQPESDTSAAASVVDANSTVTTQLTANNNNETVNETTTLRCQASCEHVTKMEQKMKRLEEKITAMSTAIKLYSFASGPPGPEGKITFELFNQKPFDIKTFRL